MELTQVLLTILLALLVLIGIGLVVALALAISAILEIFALARAVRKEVATAATALRAIGDGIGTKLGGALGVLDFLKPSQKAARTARPKKKA